MRKKHNYDKIYSMLLGSYILVLILVIFNIFKLVIEVSSNIKGISKSPFQFSPALQALSVFLLIIVVGGWFLIFKFLKKTTKEIKT